MECVAVCVPSGVAGAYHRRRGSFASVLKLRGCACGCGGVGGVCVRRWAD